MSFNIDGERLTAWLLSQQTSLIQSARERHEADGEDDPTALRMDGGAAAMGVVLNSLRSFEVSGVSRGTRRGVPPSGEGRAPIDQIEIPARLRVRRHDPGTSWEAAWSQTPERGQRMYRAIYLTLQRFGPQTDDELTHRLQNFIEQRGYRPDIVRKRRSELVQAGWVRSTAERRRSDVGAAMTVWEAVPEES